MMKRFFSYVPDDGECRHETAEEAQERVNEHIKHYREDAEFTGEWSGDVENAYWGKVKGIVKELTIDTESSDYIVSPIPPEPIETPAWRDGRTLVQPNTTNQTPLQRADDLHGKAFMPWEQAEKLALEESGIEDEEIDELIGNCLRSEVVTLLSKEEVRAFVRSILVHQYGLQPNTNSGTAEVG
jgi:hypothetical protein